MSRRIHYAKLKAMRREEEREKHFHVQPKWFCVCCHTNTREDLHDHLTEKHKSCRSNCKDFDTDRCPFKPEMWSVFGGQSI